MQRIKNVLWSVLQWPKFVIEIIVVEVIAAVVRVFLLCGRSINSSSNNNNNCSGISCRRRGNRCRGTNRRSSNGSSHCISRRGKHPRNGSCTASQGVVVVVGITIVVLYNRNGSCSTGNRVHC